MASTRACCPADVSKVTCANTHATWPRAVTARIVSYDLRSTTDQLFGLGAGCEGAMDVLLSRVSGADGWHPMPYLAGAYKRGSHCRLAFVIATQEAGIELGLSLPADGALPDFARNDAGLGGQLKALHAAAVNAPVNAIVTATPLAVELFVASFAPPPHLLLLGGGPDARPVATLAAFLGWHITVVEHRSAYLMPDRFPPSTRLVETHPADVAAAVQLANFSAAIVMSHHLESDLHYLRALAGCPVPYVGLLGPAARREKLMSDLGTDADALRPRLRAPVGLDIGGRAPESIALSIVAEVHAALEGRAGRPFTETAPLNHPS